MIRRAEKKDIGRLDDLLFQVQALHAQGRPDIFKQGRKKYTDEDLEAILADDGKPVFVYEREGRVLGYAFCVYQITEENSQVYGRKTLYIDDLCVDEGERGKQIGRELYRHVLKEAEENGCNSVTLNVWDINPGAQKFYERMGMKPLKTMMETVLDRQGHG